MIELFVFFFVILLVTLIGHAIWVFIAFLFRTVFGTTSDEKPARPEQRVMSPTDDVLKADDCVQRLTRGKFLEFSAYSIVRDKLEEAAERASVRLPSRLPSPKEASALIARPESQSVETRSARELPPIVTAELNASTSRPPSVHALEQDYRTPTPTATAQLTQRSRKAAGEMLQEFLNEKNIHWGELLSGILIVGSAVGLILSLRSQLTQIIPMFPAVLFFLVTVAIHFAGFYTLSRWKLPSTSRGLLLIGSLLIPITCLAASLLADHPGHASILEPTFIVLMALGGGAGCTLVYYAAKHLLPSQPITWTVGIMGSSLAQGFINRSVSDAASPMLLSILGCLALSGLAYVAVRTVLLPRAIASFKPGFALADSAALVPQLKLYGATFFALVIAAGLLVFRARDHLDSLLPLAIPVACLGLLISTVGCGLGRPSLSNVDTERSKSTAESDSAQWWQVASTAIMILGAVLVLSALFLAKDNVLFVIGIAITCGLASGGLATVFQQPALTTVSTLGLSFGMLLTGHLLIGNISTGPLSATALEHIATHGLTGVILLVLAVAWGLGGWWVRKFAADGEISGIEQPTSSFHSRPLPFTHWLVMLTAAGILAILAVIVSGYGACTATTMSSMCAALGVLLSGAAAGLLIGRSRDEALPMVLGSGLLLVCFATLVRPDNPVAQWIGVNSWEMQWRILVALLSHAASVTVARLSLTIAWPNLQRLKSTGASQALESNSAANKNSPLAERDVCASLQVLGLTAAVTAAAAIPLLLRWDELGYLGTQAACLILAGIVCVMQGRLNRGSSWRIVGQAAFGVAAAQLSAILFSTLTTSWLAPEQCLVLAVSVVVFAGSVIASIPAVKRSTWSALAAWKRIDADIVCMALLAYLFALSMRFWDSPAANFTPDAWLFALSMTLALAGTLLLAALRNRRFYQFVSGIVSCFTAAVVCEWLLPQTLWSSTAFMLVCMAPLAIVFGFGLYDVLIGSKRAGTDQAVFRAGGTSFEEIVSWGTLLVWFLITCLAYTAELASFTPNSVLTISSPVGLVWLLLGLVTFAIQFPIRTAIVASNRVYGASLLLALQAPLWLAGSFSSDLSQSMLLALLVSAVAVHAAFAGIVVRAVLAKGLRSNSLQALLERFFSAEYRATAASCVGKLVEVSASAVLVVSVPLALYSTDSSSLRVLALAVFMSSVGMATASTASADDSQRLPRMRGLAIGILCWFGILLAWSSLPVLDLMLLAAMRALRASSVLYISAILLVVAYSRPFLRASAWCDAIRNAWPAVLGAAIAAGLGATVLAWQQMNRETGLPAAAFDAICLALAQIVTVVVLIVQALREPWNIAQLDQKRRSNYVYFAEAIAGLTAIGMYLVFPHWFNMPFKQYWPLIVLGVALVSSAIAKLLSAKKLDVLGEPIARTSLLLPIVAAIGVFVVGSSASSDLVLALGATYYFVLAAADGSRKLAVMGMTLINVALFLFWHRYPSLDFVSHPQLWMIPPALSVLGASYFHRRELSTEATTWIRYAALGVIFLSSTSEILLTGIGQSLWPPMLLTVFSVLAVFMGISMRTRSFVYFGVVFLLVSTTAMVAHAQQSLGHTWPWWALGITLGIGILVLFGLFEKKRDEMQRWSEKLRGWEA